VIDNESKRWRSQESAKGGRAATFGGNMMERSCTGVKPEDNKSLKKVEGRSVRRQMMERSYTDVKAAAERWLRYSEAL
jgi:hypothetical protein